MGTCIEVLGPDEVVRRRYEWPGPEQLVFSALPVSDNVFLGYFTDDDGRETQGVIVNLE